MAIISKLAFSYPAAYAVERLVTPTQVRIPTKPPDPKPFLRDVPKHQVPKYITPTCNYMLDDIFYPTHRKAICKWNRSASCGPYFKRTFNCKTQGDVLDNPKLYQRVLDTIHYTKCGKHRNFKSYFCNVSAKYDLEKDIAKYRNAFVQDMSLTALERTFVESITYDSDRKVPSPKLHNDLCFGNVMSLDITSFDTTISAQTIRQAFAYLFSKFDLRYYRPDENVKEFRPVYSVHSMHRLINVIVHNFIHTKFYDQRGNQYQKHHGIPSGSAFTNIIATICANMLAHAVVKEQGLEAYVHTHGDDTFIVFPPEIDADSEELRKCVVHGYMARGMSVKIAERLPWGCHIFCKTWCLSGRAFHPGVIFSNILNTLRDMRYWDMVVEMLRDHYDATELQKAMLSQLTGFDAVPQRSWCEAPMWLLRLVTRGEIAM